MTNWQSAFKEVQAKTQSPLLKAAREEAFRNFLDVGMPTTKLESWKHTNLKVITDGEFKTLKPTAASSEIKGFNIPINPKELLKHLMGDMKFDYALFTDGVWNKALSQMPLLSEIKVTPIAELSGKEKNWILNQPIPETGSQEVAISQSSTKQVHSVSPVESGIHLLNGALSENGFHIEVTEGVSIPKPFVIFNLTTDAGAQGQWHLRNQVTLGRNSKATIIEFCLGFGGEKTFNTNFLGVHCAEGSSLNHIKIQEESLATAHVGTFKAQQDKGSHIASHCLNWGGALGRQEYIIDLNGRDARCDLKGLFFGKAKQQSEIIIDMRHNSSHTSSDQLFKGVLEDDARGVFYGKVFVQKDAQKINALQSNKNILLSDGAVVDSRPQLEIHADDVKCNHGSAIGRLDPEALFYLRSRGIGKKEAEALLLMGFAEEVFADLEFHQLKDRLNRLLKGAL